MRIDFLHLPARSASKGDRVPCWRCGLVVMCLLLAGCRSRPVPVASDEPPDKLSAYQLFQGNGATQEPAAGVLPYDVNTPLFSDYALKYRFVRLPPGTSAEYHETDSFAFPVGTILVKTFAYPHDFTNPLKGRRLIETRLLIHEPDGWVGLPYVWNDEQTEATLKVAGGTRDVSWTHSDGQQRSVKLPHPERQPVQGLPREQPGPDADRAEGQASQPRLRLRRRS